jgi:hypothetical protein
MCEAPGIPLKTQLLMILSLLFVAAAIGCNGQGGVQAIPEPNLRLIGVLYSQYLSAHKGEAPRNAEEFRAFVQSLGPGVLERAGVSGMDELLVSVRDGEWLAVKYQDHDWLLEGAIVYEQIGRDGTRFVVTDMGGVSELSEQEFLNRLKK